MSDVRVATEADRKAAPARPASEQEIRAIIARHSERADRLQDRWSLSLAIANAGALAALAAKVLDGLSTEATIYSTATLALALPSLWLFATGLAFAGLIPLIELIQLHKLIATFKVNLRLVLAHPDAEATFDESKSSWGWRVVNWGPEILSGVCFCSGLIYPLVVLALRYVRDGGVAW